MNDLKRNKHFPKKIASNLKFLNNLQPEWSRHVTIVHQTKNLHTADYTQLYEFLKYNQKDVDELKAERLAKTQDPLALMRISSNPRNRQIAQPSMNMGQDRQIQMVEGNGENQFRQYAGNPAGYNDIIRNQVIQNAVQNLGVQNVGNPNGLIGVQGNGNQNQIGNGNLVAARAEGNAAGQNGNQIRCYNCRGKEEAGIQLQAKEYDLMAIAADLDEIKEVNANYILMANLQQASTSGTQTDSALVYDTDGSAESDNNVISEDTSVEQCGETIEQHPANFEETRALYESLYQNLAIEVKKVNLVNRKLKETNTDLTTELGRYKNRERCFEISQEKYDKLESTGKQIMTLNEKISDLNKQLSKEKSTVSFLLEEKKKLKSDFKTYEDKLLDKQIQLEKRIKELNNIVLKTGQSIQTIHVLSPKPDSFYHTEHKMALGYQNPFYLKQAQKKQQSLYDGKVLLEKHDPPIVHDSEETPDFKSLLNEADASLAKHKTLELEIKRLFKAVVSQDIISVVQNESVVDTSNLQTKLESTKECFENCIIKKKTEYAKLWNDWYKKCDECKYDKLLYVKAYKDMQQKIERLQAQLGDLKGKSKDTSSVSDTRNQLSQKLENENVELEF
nr:hypothetical protein [Tanacetum cinerariifolium]